MVRYVIDGDTWLHDLGGVLFPIFHTYTMNEFLIETQLRVDSGLDLVVDTLLTYIDISPSPVLVLYK